MKDILLDNNNDLLMANGDLVTGNSLAQDIDLIVGSNPGDVRQWPLVGVGIFDYLNAPYTPDVVAALKRNVTTQLRGDGMKNVVVATTKGLETLKITAER